MDLCIISYKCIYNDFTWKGSCRQGAIVEEKWKQVGNHLKFPSYQPSSYPSYNLPSLSCLFYSPYPISSLHPESYKFSANNSLDSVLPLLLSHSRPQFTFIFYHSHCCNNLFDLPHSALTSLYFHWIPELSFSNVNLILPLLCLKSSNGSLLTRG